MFTERHISFILLSAFFMVGAYGYGGDVALHTSRSDKCHKEFSCASCSQVRICSKDDGGWSELIEFICNSTTPYCDDATGTCSSTPSLKCAPKDNFICMRDGTFPDPSDCTQYHVCNNNISYAYKCVGATYIYDSGKEKCVSGATCYNFSCTGKSGVKVAYGNNANIFTYCVHGKPYIVDRCPANYELSSNEQTCQPKCYSEKQVPDVDDCTKYYKCTKDIYGTYKLSHEECPSGNGFDPVYSRCVSLSLLPECK